MIGAIGLGKTFLSETLTWIAACSTRPSNLRCRNVDTLIRALRAKNLWTNCGRLVSFAMDTQQAGLLDIKDPTKSYTLVNAESWSTGGIIGDKVSASCSFGENLDTSGQWSLNSAGWYWYCNSEQGGVGTNTHVGVTSGRAFCTPRNNTGSENYEVNDGSPSDVFQANVGSRLGGRLITRTASNQKLGYYNGSQVSSLSTASTSLATANAHFHRFNTTFGSDQIAFSWMGAGLNSTQAADLHTIAVAYLTAIGAN